MRVWGLLSVLPAVFLALGGCQTPKHFLYQSPLGDYSCEVPWGWAYDWESDGMEYTHALFTGSFEPDFFLGVPSLSVRWYAYNKIHKLPDGRLEVYSSSEDYIQQMIRDVYSPEYQWVQPLHDVLVSHRTAKHFVVLSPVEAPPNARWGLSVEEGANRYVNLRQHAYVIVPLKRGMYVLIYPATRQGYARYKERFNRLVNSFRILKDGPGGEELSPF